MSLSYNKHEDPFLIELMRQGDIDAFNVLFNRYNHVLLDYAIRLVRDKTEAADILQDIFISLWNRREVISFSHSFKAWLYQAVRFRAARYIQQCKRKDAVLAELVFLLPRIEQNRGISAFDHEKLQHAIHDAIEEMPPRMKEIFILSREAQLSHREIGLKLNIAETTVKKTVQNALRFLRKNSIIEFIVVTIFLIA